MFWWMYFECDFFMAVILEKKIQWIIAIKWGNWKWYYNNDNRTKKGCFRNLSVHVSEFAVSFSVAHGIPEWMYMSPSLDPLRTSNRISNCEASQKSIKLSIIFKLQFRNMFSWAKPNAITIYYSDILGQRERTVTILRISNQ